MPVRALLVAVAALCLLPPARASAAARKAKPAPCRDGRFLVPSGDLLVGPGRPLVLEEARLSIGSVCPEAAAKVKRARRKTMVRARWEPCGGYESPVRLRATIDAECATMRGRLLARRPKLKAKFTAQRSRCGDGVVDEAAGEECEGAGGCATGPCASCACPTTTSTSTSVTTTTSTSTTFQGALAPDFIMFSGSEIDSPGEGGEDNGCSPVDAPVRSGARACRINLGFFSRLRPSGFSHETLFVRVYHRIDVATPPAAESFAPVIVTDVLPNGVSAVDVGVSPDSTIRYRLRNRRTSTNLGLTERFASGQWIRLELKTTVGAATGSAELRIDGVTALTAEDQAFGDEPLDAVFISNNPNQYPEDGGAHGGAWTATFDDMAMTKNEWPGAGRVIARQGAPGMPTDSQWTVVGADTIDAAWSQTPGSNAARAETPDAGNPLAQTMRVARLDEGLDRIGDHNTVKACQVWMTAGLLAGPPNRTYAIRRRVGGVVTDVPLAGLTTTNEYFSDALVGGFWRDSLANLNGAEIGAVKSGGAGGSGMRVADVWLVCEYQ
jgi:hypothetical protein